jgi:hypothetical protein
MKAEIKTKSNYRNFNGQFLEVKEIAGTRVSCIVDTEEFGPQTVDFTLSEVKSFKDESGKQFWNIN